MSETQSALDRLMEQGRTITLDELEALWVAYWRDHDPEVKGELAAQYALMVRYVARLVAANAPAFVDREDHLSYGYVGLIHAIERFDPGIGVKFETYATRKIKGAILDGLRKEDPLTRKARGEVKALYVEYNRLWDENGREPTYDELAQASGLTREVVASTMLLSKTLSAELDPRSNAHDDQMYGIAEIHDGHVDDPELEAEFAALRRTVAPLVADLDDRQQQFIMLHYGDGLRLKQIGEIMGISDARVGQIRLSVVEAIRRTSL